MPNTSPDSIYYPDTAAAQNQPAYMGTHASSVQAALSLRQRYTFVWANATARTSQLGMGTGSTGYQVDTKTEYKYENGAWRLATEYAEFDISNVSVPSGTYTTPVFTYNAGSSTSASLATSPASGTITVTNPGIYGLSWYLEGPVAFAGTNFIAISPDTARSSFYAVAPFVGNVATAPVPFLNIPGAGTSLYFYIYQATGNTANFRGKVRMGRVA